MVTFWKDGLPVTTDDRVWSWDNTLKPIAPNAYVGSNELDPVEVYRTQSSVRTVVGFLARNVAQVAVHAFTKDQNADRQRDITSPVSRLMEHPSETSTPYELMRNLVTDVCLFDRWAAFVAVDNNGDTELVRLPPSNWTFTRDPLGRPVAVEYEDELTEETYPVSSLVWLDGFPDLDGASPMEALRDLLIEESESSSFRREMWKNGARMPGWISRPDGAPMWSPQGKASFRDGWNEYAAGGVRVGRTPILEDGMQYHELTSSFTPETAQQLETRKFSIAEISAFYFVPPVFVGILDNANYSNVSAYREILYSDTLGPWFQQIQQAFNRRLLPLMNTLPGEYVEFNVGEKLRMAFDQQADIFAKSTGAPIMTRNEARRYLNLPSLDGADDLIVPLNLGQQDDADAGAAPDIANMAGADLPPGFNPNGAT